MLWRPTLPLQCTENSLNSAINLENKSAGIFREIAYCFISFALTLTRGINFPAGKLPLDSSNFLRLKIGALPEIQIAFALVNKHGILRMTMMKP
jgi:hypothetical protein